MTAVPEDEVLPCGCVLRCAVVGGVNVLTIVPCRQTCASYRAALDLARAAGKPVERREAP